MESDIKRVAESIAQANISTKNQDFIIEVCCSLHKVYAEFQSYLIPAIIKQFRNPVN